MDGLSLRQVEIVLTRMGELFGFDAPDFTTVRLWVQRVGLYLWQRTPPSADDWIWILDHVAEAGGGKCLVIVGVRRTWLSGGNFALQHTDVVLLYAEVMQSCTGNDMYRILVALAQLVGVPVQMVSDHGSDVLKGERLFQAEHPGLVLTWDITHRLARLLLGAIKGDDAWLAFKAESQRTRTAVNRTPWAALAPPSTAGASRCEHFDPLALWGEKTLAQLDAGARGLIDSQYQWDPVAAGALCEVLSEPEQQRLQALLGQSFSQASTFTAAVEAALQPSSGSETRSETPLSPSAHTATIVRASDQGARRCREHFGWLETYRQALAQEYLPLVRMTYSAEKLVKHTGLHGASATEWRATQPRLPRTWRRARKFRADVLRYLRTEGRRQARDAALLATSDVLESVFGKYKRYTERSPQTALNSSILNVPIVTETLTPELVEIAIESTPQKTLTKWCQKTFGRTKLAMQRLLNHLSPSTDPA